MRYIHIYMYLCIYTECVTHPYYYLFNQFEIDYFFVINYSLQFLQFLYMNSPIVSKFQIKILLRFI